MTKSPSAAAFSRRSTIAHGLRWSDSDIAQKSWPSGAPSLAAAACIAGTPGAEFLQGLRTERFHCIWRKGYQREFEAYAVTAQHAGFAPALCGSGVTSVVVCGIATNICCFFAARDLRRSGLQVYMVENASAGIDVPAAGLFQAKAREEGRQAGIRYVTTSEILS